MCYPGVLWEYGLNLYLFKTDKKTGNTAEYICPPNGNPFYYHYTEEFVTNKTAFFVFSTSRNYFLRFKSSNVGEATKIEL